MRNWKNIRYYKVRRSSECLDERRDGAVALIYAGLFGSGLASMRSNLAHNMLSLCGADSLPEVPPSAFSDSTSKCHLSHTALCCWAARHCVPRSSNAELPTSPAAQFLVHSTGSAHYLEAVRTPRFHAKIHLAEHDCGKCTSMHFF